MVKRVQNKKVQHLSQWISNLSCLIIDYIVLLCRVLLSHNGAFVKFLSVDTTKIVVGCSDTSLSPIHVWNFTHTRKNHVMTKWQSTETPWWQLLWFLCTDPVHLRHKKLCSRQQLHSIRKNFANFLAFLPLFVYRRIIFIGETFHLHFSCKKTWKNRWFFHVFFARKVQVKCCTFSYFHRYLCSQHFVTAPALVFLVYVTSCSSLRTNYPMLKIILLLLCLIELDWILVSHSRSFLEYLPLLWIEILSSGMALGNEKFTMDSILIVVKLPWNFWFLCGCFSLLSLSPKFPL